LWKVIPKWFEPHNVSDNPVCGPAQKRTEPMTNENEANDVEAPDDEQTRRSLHCYAAGWRPEKALKQAVLDMVAIVFDSASSVDECEMAASTIVEAVHPEIMAKATGQERRLWESA
jgi:hypothetical protein